MRDATVIKAGDYVSFNSLFEMLSLLRLYCIAPKSRTFNSLFEMHRRCPELAQLFEETFNSLFEMRIRAEESNRRRSSFQFSI